MMAEMLLFCIDMWPNYSLNKWNRLHGTHALTEDTLPENNILLTQIHFEPITMNTTIQIIKLKNSKLPSKIIVKI